MTVQQLTALLLTIFCLTSLQAQQQDSINFERLEARKLIKLLKKNDIYTKADLHNVDLACYDANVDSISFSSDISTFTIEAGIEEVWKAYNNVSPTEQGGKKAIVNFGMLYDNQSNKIYYSEDSYDGMQEGQLVFWNLRLLGGLVKLSVGQTVTNIDNQSRSFEICYLDQGTSHGSQYIQLFEMGDDATQVVHYTRFRSASKFRDRRLYPGIHEKAVTEFHERIKDAVEKSVE